jgi:nucleoside-diphosphate-sugar epimerase
LDNEGLGSRDFIYVEDMARGLIHCAVKGKPAEIYNLASGRETTIAEIAKIINEQTNNPTPPSFSLLVIGIVQGSGMVQPKEPKMNLVLKLRLMFMKEFQDWLIGLNKIIQ